MSAVIMRSPVGELREVEDEDTELLVSLMVAGWQYERPAKPVPPAEEK